MLKFGGVKKRSSSQGANRNQSSKEGLPSLFNIGIEKQKENLRNEINKYKSESRSIRAQMKELQDTVQQFREENERLRFRAEQNKFERNCIRTDLTEVRDQERAHYVQAGLQPPLEVTDWSTTNTSIRDNDRTLNMPGSND